MGFITHPLFGCHMNGDFLPHELVCFNLRELKLLEETVIG